MTTRERFARTLTGQDVDRVPFMKVFGGTNAVVSKWRKQHPNIGTYIDELLQFEGQYRGWQIAPVATGMYGSMPADVVEAQSPDETRVRRGDGSLVVVLHQGDHSFSHTAEYPAKTREDWESIKANWLDPNAPGRFPSDWQNYVTIYRQRDYPLQLTCGGVYGFTRTVLGDETLMLAMYDDPEWIHDIVNTYIDMCIDIWKRMVRDVAFDLIECWEDMAYNSGSLISKQHFDHFLAPQYKKIRDFAGNSGIPLVLVDSDGYIMDLAHWMSEAGVNCMYPFEVQAGNSVPKVRSELPGMGCIGALDKNCMSAGGSAIDDELERARLLIRGGRCIPGPDHFVLEDVPYENYERFMRGLRDVILSETF